MVCGAILVAACRPRGGNPVSQEAASPVPSSPEKLTSAAPIPTPSPKLPSAASAPAPPIPRPSRTLSAAIDCKKPGKPISDHVYGIAWDLGDPAPQSFRMGATSRRWGGNASSRYNMDIGAWNSAHEW